VRRGIPPAVRRTARRLVDSAGWLRLKAAPEGELRAQARASWTNMPPDPGLTWGLELTGDAFVTKAVEHGLHGTVLEVGPGYGRLLEAATRLDAPFESWIGVDLSPQNVEHLRDRWPEHEFVVGDAETIAVDERVDTIVSSLTFKHVFPTFEKLLQNLARILAPDGLVVIDLIEGQHLRHFEPERRNFIRSYSRSEIQQIFTRCGLSATFDYVEHAPGWARLLVVGRVV
jgi:SAM-dependent methyltransferase